MHAFSFAMLRRKPTRIELTADDAQENEQLKKLLIKV
jgi:hypothetical protein